MSIMVAKQVQKHIHGRNGEEKLVEINKEESVMQFLVEKMNSERNPEERETPEHIVFLFNHWKRSCDQLP